MSGITRQALEWNAERAIRKDERRKVWLDAAQYVEMLSDYAAGAGLSGVQVAKHLRRKAEEQ